MKKYRFSVIVLGLAILAPAALAGGPINIEWSNDASAITNDGRLFLADGITPVSAGDLSVTNDGFLLQLVAFQGGTNYVLASDQVGDLPGLVNGPQGDNVSGYFNVSTSIGSNVLAGAVGSVMGLIFYASPTVSSVFGVVSNTTLLVPSPNWETPPSPFVFALDVLDSNWQGLRTPSNTGFMMIPEPTSGILVTAGTIGLLLYRRRKN